MSDKKKTPSLWQMTKNFSKDLATYVKEGAPNVSEEEYKFRLEKCYACEYFIKDKARCRACGCLVEYKARWKTTKCPKNKWAPQIKSYGKIEKNNNTKDSNKT